MAQQYRAPSIQKPTLAQLEKIVTELGLNMSPEELTQYQELVEEGIAVLSGLDDLPEPVLLPVKYPRTPGYRPPPEENKYNAWYYKTDIQGSPKGKLHDKKIVIKDNVAVAGVPMMNGTRLLEGYTPEYDASIVTRILDAGGQITGKAVCEHLCFSGSGVIADTGPVLNPHDLTRPAGGSSAGSAVLVQTGEADMGTGGDQGGSIRMPASWVGIVGLKPTFGLVPMTGLFNMEASLDHSGPMARTVHDCALLLEVMAGYDDGLDARQPRDIEVPAYSQLLGGDLSGMKIGLVQEGFRECEEDTSTLVEACAQKLTTTGASVQKMSVPTHKMGKLLYTSRMSMGGYQTMVQNASCAYGLRGFQPTSLINHMTNAQRMRANDMISPVKAIAIQSEYLKQNYGNRYYVKGHNFAIQLTKDYDKALETYDVLIMPTMPYKAPKIPAQDMPTKEFFHYNLDMIINTSPFNVTGHPALSINAGFSDGLPVGMMIVGKKFDETTVFKVARAFEEIRDKK